MVNPMVRAIQATPIMQESDGWQEPEPIPNTLEPVEAFLPELLPDAFRPWVEDACERMQCPPDFMAVGAMIALASVVGRSVSIRPKRLDSWQCVPNLWGGVVGRPGIHKSPALSEALLPLKRLEAQAAESYTASMADYEATQVIWEQTKNVRKDEIKKAIRKKQDTKLLQAELIEALQTKEPTRERFIVNDPTVEKLGEILQDSPRGILLFRDELTGFLKNLDRPGAEGSRTFYLESWAGDSRYTFDRIGRGTVEIDACCVSILGGIQPGPLQTYMTDVMQGGAGDDGLLQRFQLLVWPDAPPNWKDVDRLPDSKARREAYAVFDRLVLPDLATIAQCHTDEHSPIPFLRFSDEASEAFTEWRHGLEARIRSGELFYAMEAHLSKYRSLTPSMALLIHLADVGYGPVGLASTEKALAWGEYLESHAVRVYGIGRGVSHESAQHLLKQLHKGAFTGPFTARDVWHKGWSGLNDSETATHALKLLAEYNHVRTVDIPTTGKGGRPTAMYELNPKSME